MNLRKILKPYFLVPLILLLLIVLLFLIWFLMPKTELYIAVLDKTVPATAADSHSYLGDVSNNYRKHLGLNWILNHRKIINPATDEYYDYRTDYYGPHIDENNKIIANTALSSIKEIPDLLYLSDTYGVELQEDRGISAEDMNTIALCHSSGSVIIGEHDIKNTGTAADQNAELEALFGVRSTGWVGRYIYDLQDMSDVPYWAPGMYEQKYGQEWKVSGPGILLVSADGDILVLEEKNDFESKNLLKIYINEEYRDEFGKHSANFYNWFDLIEADYGTEVIATFEFNVNSNGAKQLAAVSDTTKFAAVTRKAAENKAPVYYFAGDFNDYVTKEQISCFLFADTFFRWLSFDREGDVTYFYWTFYVPLMNQILEDIEDNPIKRADDGEKTTTEISRVDENSLQIQVDGKWKNFTVKGFNINGEEPGNMRHTYSRDFTFYQTLVRAVGDMGGNCIRTYDLLPPEFYRAVYEYNKASGNPIYILQGVLVREPGATPSELLNQPKTAETRIQNAIRGVHGDGILTVGEQSYAYAHNVSQFTLGYILDFELSKKEILELNDLAPDLSYKGTYFTAESNVMEALAATYCDYALDYHSKTYGYKVPVSVRGTSDLLSGAAWNDAGYGYNLCHLSLSAGAEQYYFASYSLNTNDAVLLNNTAKFSEYSDNEGAFAYGGYIRAVKDLCQGQVLIDAVGLSTNSNMFEKETSVNGLSEKEQGAGLIRILKTVGNSSYIGALIADLNDNWSGSSDEFTSHTLPSHNNGLWYNIADSAETTGVLAVEPVRPKEVNMELNDNAFMQQMQLSVDQGYVYATIILSQNIDFDNRQLFLGIDTYQRNNGEYYYDKNYFANSLSGMEYIVKFESKNSASLYVANSYNRDKGNYASKESYTAAYDLVSVLNYGDFSSSNTHFYQTGMTIHIRIPWAMLNFTDPSQRSVINGIDADGKIQTTQTEGMIFSVLVGDKQTQDTVYIFPLNKQQAGYKTLKWGGWEPDKINYQIREKNSVNVMKRYFTKGM